MSIVASFPFIFFLYITAKLEDLDDRLPTVESLLQAAQTGPDPYIYTREEYHKMEMYVLKFFNWCVSLVSPAHFSGYFLKHCPEWSQRVFPTSVLQQADLFERKLYMEHYTDYFIELGIRGEQVEISLLEL